MPPDPRSAQMTLPKWHSDDGNIARNGSYLMPTVKAAASCWSYVCSGWSAWACPAGSCESVSQLTRAPLGRTDASLEILLLIP
eukprot:1439425-Pleurochrysis_carterae.AAC.1